jgi:predicted ATPase/DNA-binding XRE family transcriptional regulator
MEVEVSFGLWLQKRRKALDLTRDELAQKIGCSVSALRKIETDQRHPSRQLAELLAYALQIPEVDRSAFVRIARGELPLAKRSFEPILPNLNLLQFPQTFSKPIPVPATPLVGRETELAALRRMLSDPQCRLITLGGPGGSGKTRLAIEAAHHPGTAFLHGVVFVALAGVNSTDPIAPAIANALGFKFEGLGDLDNQLLNYLRERQVLLILDNLEHLLDGVRIISEIMEYAPRVKVLSTSREQLNLRGEWMFEVRGLTVPENEQLEKLEDYSAVALFLACARRMRAGFVLRPEDRSAVVQICRSVGGMPLAIELAATWVQTLSCQEISQEIERDLGILTASTRDLPERHRSMQVVFDYSWRRLSDKERSVLMSLSVFQGGFTREMAEQVTGVDLVMLSTLVAKSLVQWGTERRYSLHELVQQYAFAQLQSFYQVEQTRTAHLQAFVHLAERIEPRLTESEQERWLAYLETEHDNFRAALHWALDSGDGESSLRLAGALWRFWHMRSYFVEGSQWLERALHTAGSHAPAALRAKALDGAGSFAHYQNHFAQARDWLEECLAMKSDLDERRIAHAQSTLAMVVQEQSDFDRAWNLYEQAIQSFRRLNDEHGILRTLNNQGTLAYDMANFELAERMFLEVLTLARKRNDKDYIATALINLGWAAAIRGDSKASDLCKEALTLVRELNSKYSLAFCLEGMAAGMALQDHPDRAVRLFGATNALRKSISASLSGANLRYLEAMLQPARNALPAEAFAAAWAEGEAMSIEEAIELALVCEKA